MAFLSVQTQWTAIGGGMSAPVFMGLRYEGVVAALSMAGLPKGRWPQTFDDLRVMESAAMRELNKSTGDGDGG